jgi:hypothetical protein
VLRIVVLLVSGLIAITDITDQSHLVAVLRCAKWWLVAYGWVRFLPLAFEHSNSIPSVQIIHGYQGPSTPWSP